MTHIEDEFTRIQENIDRQYYNAHNFDKNKSDNEIKDKLKNFIERKDLSRKKSEEEKAFERAKSIKSLNLKKISTTENEYKNNLNSKKQEEFNILNQIKNLTDQINNSRFKEFLRNIPKESSKKDVENLFETFLIEKDIEIKPSEQIKTIELAARILENKSISDEDIKMNYACIYKELEIKKQSELDKTNKILNEIKEDKFREFFIELMK